MTTSTQPRFMFHMSPLGFIRLWDRQSCLWHAAGMNRGKSAHIAVHEILSKLADKDQLAAREAAKKFIGDAA